MSEMTIQPYAVDPPSKPGPDRDPMEGLAYEEWARMPDKMSRGALTILGGKLGIHPKKLSDWKKRYGWEVRLYGEMVAVGDKVRQAAEGFLLDEYFPALARLAKIARDAERDQDAINAVKVMSALVMPISPGAKHLTTPSAGDQVGHGSTYVDKQLVIMAKDMSRDELFSKAQEVLNQHREDSLATRQTKRSALPAKIANS